MVSKEYAEEVIRQKINYRNMPILGVDFFDGVERIIVKTNNLQTTGSVSLGELFFDGSGYVKKESYFIDITSGNSTKNIPLSEINPVDFLGRVISFYDPFL